MADRDLPDRPQLGQYKTQAEELVKAWKDGNPDAQLAIAREHHFETWEQFASYAEALKDTNSPLAQFEAAVEAIVSGDVPALERLLRENPDLLRARSARKHHSTLLHYVGANGVEDFRQRTPKNVVRVAEILLDAGADINETAEMYGGSDTLGLVATSIHPVHAGVHEELMALLLSRGATIAGAPGGSAWSSLINACHANGRPEGAAFLAARAVGLDLEAAAGVGRLDVVQTYFSGDGALTNGATPRQMKDGFAWACEFGRTAVVDFLLRQGMDVAEKLRHHGQTGLHWAAYEGHADTVRLLIERHSPINAIDDEFGGTPLGWALYAWGGGGPHPGHSRYYEVIEQLIAAGATVDAEWLNESERGFPLAKRIRDDERLRAALERTVRRRPIP